MAKKLIQQESATKTPEVALKPGGTPGHHDANPFAGLQRTIGNQAVLQLLGIQAKLRVSQPGDADELEADRVADQIVSTKHAPVVQRKCSCSGGTSRTQCAMEEPEAVHLKTKSPTKEDNVPAPARLPSSLGSGQPFDPATRGFMESRFGHDFSGIRIHTGAAAAERTESVNARAFTFGRNIVFGSGEYAPESMDGKRLLAHELAHSIQQGRSATNCVQRQPRQDVSSHQAAASSTSPIIGQPIDFLVRRVALVPEEQWQS